MLRAVPAMIFIAASMSFAVRSGIFCSAIARSLSRVSDADLGLVRLSAALLEAERLLDEDRRGRSLGDEGEALVRVDRDDHRDEHAFFLLAGPLVELLAELCRLHAVRPQRRSDGGRRGGLARGHLQLDECLDCLLRHFAFTSVVLSLSS